MTTTERGGGGGKLSSSLSSTISLSVILVTLTSVLCRLNVSQCVTYIIQTRPNYKLDSDTDN